MPYYSGKLKLLLTGPGVTGSPSNPKVDGVLTQKIYDVYAKIEKIDDESVNLWFNLLVPDLNRSRKTYQTTGYIKKGKIHFALTIQTETTFEIPTVNAADVRQDVYGVENITAYITEGVLKFEDDGHKAFLEGVGTANINASGTIYGCFKKVKSSAVQF